MQIDLFALTFFLEYTTPLINELGRSGKCLVDLFQNCVSNVARGREFCARLSYVSKLVRRCSYCKTTKHRLKTWLLVAQSFDSLDGLTETFV